MQISEILSTERFVRTPDGGEAQVLEVALVEPDGHSIVNVFSAGEVVGTVPAALVLRDSTAAPQ